MRIIFHNPCTIGPVTFTARHVEHRHTITIPRAMPGALELFTPIGECAWAEGWAPTWLFPTDGSTTAGMVFTTDHGNEHTIWTMTRHDAAAGEVEYVRTTPGSRVGVVRVRCAAAGASETRVEVSYAITTLTEQGDAAIAALDEARFAAFIDSWREAIARL